MISKNVYLELRSIEIACLNARVNYLRKGLWRIATYSMQIYRTNFSAIKQSGHRRYFSKKKIHFNINLLLYSTIFYQIT